MKQVDLILVQIEYTGDNIGREFAIELFINSPDLPIAKRVSLNTRIRRGQVLELNEHLLGVRLHRDSTINVNAIVTEIDDIEDPGAASFSLPVFFARGFQQRDASMTIAGRGGDPKGSVATLSFRFVAAVQDIPGPPPILPGDPVINEPGIDVPNPEATYAETVSGTRYGALAVWSDLHIGDGSCNEDFDPEDETEFIRACQFLVNLQARLGANASGEQGRPPLTVVFNGDVIELWETQKYWSPGDDPVEIIDKCKDKLDRIVAAHPRVFQAIRELDAALDGELVYVWGNHDDMVAVPQIQSYINNDLQLPFVFKAAHEAEDLRAYAEHGHRFDCANFTDKPLEEKPLGRWIVENFSARLELLADGDCRSPFDNIDAFSPLADYPKYIRCLRAQSAMSFARFREFRILLNNLVNNAPVGPGTAILRNLFTEFLVRTGRGSVEKRFAAFQEVAKNRGPGAVKRDKAEQVVDEQKKRNKNVQCVLFGHTHEELIEEIGPERFYVNTGAWTDKQSANEGDPCKPIDLPNRHMTLLIRDDDFTRFGETNKVVQIYTVRFTGGPISHHPGTRTYKLDAA